MSMLSCSSLANPCLFFLMLMDGWMDRCKGWTDGRTEFLPILQDFVPYRGRCPATFNKYKQHNNETTKKQGKGIADLMMPFGDWFLSLFAAIKVS